MARCCRGLAAAATGVRQGVTAAWTGTCQQSAHFAPSPAAHPLTAPRRSSLLRASAFGWPSLPSAAGDHGRDQVVNLHYMLSKASVKARPSVLWCYKKELGFTSHRQKRMRKIKREIARGIRTQEEAAENPFELFVSATDIRYWSVGGRSMERNDVRMDDACVRTVHDPAAVCVRVVAHPSFPLLSVWSYFDSATTRRRTRFSVRRSACACCRYEHDSHHTAHPSPVSLARTSLHFSLPPCPPPSPSSLPALAPSC